MSSRRYDTNGEVNSPGLLKSSMRSLSIVAGGIDYEVESPGNDHNEGVVGEDERYALHEHERRQFSFS